MHTNKKCMSITIVISIILMLTLMPLMQVPLVKADAPLANTYEKAGPYVDEMLIHVFYTPEAEFLSLEAGVIDVTDWALTAEKVDEYAGAQWADKIYTYEYAEFGFFLIDLNHNRWPISSLDFRKALAHLVDKDTIVTDIVKGYGVPVTTTVLPAHGAWLNTDLEDYDYDPTEAANILDAAGFTLGADGYRIDPQTGTTLRSLDFYIRVDDPLRRGAGELIADAMTSVGIPVNVIEPEKSVCYEKVMIVYEFDMYTGGWINMLETDYLFDLWHSTMYVGPDDPWSNNYGGYAGADDEVYDAKYAPTYEEAVNACWAAQEKMFADVANIPLWTTVGVKAVAAGWEGIVNELGIGVNSWWTFLNARKTGTTIHYGFKSNIESLNPVKAQWYWDWEVIGKIYDSLIVPDPFTREDVGSLAESWEAEPWTSTGVTDGTKLTYNLRDDVSWHDGTAFTSADVKFTIDYFIEQQPPRYIASIDSVINVETPDAYTVEVNCNATSYFLLHWIGWLPIIPKHIWETVGDDWNLLEPNTPKELVGTGPFKFAEWVKGEYVRLVKNQDYFLLTERTGTAVVSVNAPTSLTTGEVQKITVTLPISNDTARDTDVTVKIIKEDVTVAEFELKYMGSAVYEGPFIPLSLAPGDYDVKVEASGASSGTWKGSVSITSPMSTIEMVSIGAAVVAIIFAGGAIAYARKKK